jgi:uncharacterized protein (TIGR02217 family)
MTFLETPRFPTTLRFGLTGGPEYSTGIVTVNSGWESRNVNWSEARGKWSAEYGPHSKADTDLLVAHFRSVKGSAHGFRFKDPADYSATVAEGTLGAGVGTGYPTYQLTKNYTAGALSEARPIRKPLVSGVTTYRGGSPVTWGTGAGQASIDTTTGIVSFVADASSASSAITVGATTTVRLAANLGLVAGKLLYLNGFTGADAALVNSIAHTINSISGAGPYDFVLATNTSGKTITVGSGIGYKYPQVSDALTWAGSFDVPVRFETDYLGIQALEGGHFAWNDVKLVEIRT